MVQCTRNQERRTPTTNQKGEQTMKFIKNINDVISKEIKGNHILQDATGIYFQYTTECVNASTAIRRAIKETAIHSNVLTDILTNVLNYESDSLAYLNLYDRPTCYHDNFIDFDHALDCQIELDFHMIHSYCHYIITIYINRYDFRKYEHYLAMAAESKSESTTESKSESKSESVMKGEW